MIYHIKDNKYIFIISKFYNFYNLNCNQVGGYPTSPLNWSYYIHYYILYNKYYINISYHLLFTHNIHTHSKCINYTIQISTNYIFSCKNSNWL